MTGLKKALRSRRGFTLVELIVVLVIMGVLGTVTVPALTGYIDSSKEKQAVSETQACVETVTRIAAQKYAEWQQATVSGTNKNAEPLMDWAGTTADKAPDVSGGDVALTEGTGRYLLHVTNPPSGGIMTRDVSNDAGVSGHVNTFTCNNNGQLLYLVYTSADGITVVYTNVGTSSSVSNGDIENVVVPTPDGGKPTPTPTPENPTENKLTVTFYKKDAGDKTTAVIGAKMYVGIGTSGKSWTTDENGYSLALSKGTYTLVEEAAPNGYTTADPITFSVVESNGVLLLSGPNENVSATNNSVTMYDTKQTVVPVPDLGTVKVTIHLEDAVTKAPMAGLTFTMYPVDHENEAFTVTTDENGNIVLPIHHSIQSPNTDFIKYAIQEYWSYTLVEQSAPDGYQALQTVKFGFQLQYEPYDQSKINMQTSGSSNKFNGEYLGGDASAPVLHIQRYTVPVLHIRKVNTNGTRLSGAKFDLYDTQWDGKKLQYTFTSNADNDYDFNLEVKLHSGDNPISNNYIELSSSRNSIYYYMVEETAPVGYTTAPNQGFAIKITNLDKTNNDDSFDFDFVTEDWAKLNSEYYIAEPDSRPLHHVLTIIDKPNATTPAENTCKVNISKKVYKKDGDNKTSADTEQVLMPANLKAILKLTGPNTSEQWTTNGAAKTFNLRPGTYKLQELTAPNGYLVAMPITFTVKDTDTSLDISMLDLTTADETDKPTFPLDNITVTLEPKSWAHKLTHDGLDKNGNGKLSFNKELLIWNGELYYNYNYSDADTKNLKNDRQKEFDNFFNQYGVMPSDTPDPITFMNKLGKTGTDYLIKLTGNFYLWNTNYPPVNSLSKGDVLVVPAGTSYKAFIYKKDTPTVITNSDSKGNPYKNGKAYIDAHEDDFTSNIGESYISFVTK